MLLRLLRFIAYLLAFWFIYKVVVGAFQYLAGGSQRKETPESKVRQESKEREQPTYPDVRDAEFKDLPKDPTKPS